MSKELIHEFYGKQVDIKRMITDKIIAISPANRDKYFPTVTGILFFCENPQHFIPEATVICSRFKGDSGRNIIQTEELSGPLGRLVESSFRLLCSWMEKDFKLLGTQLHGNIPIPKEALREAIINSLIHRKYSIPGPVKIALFDHHLEIFNPGSFPGLVDLENLGDGITYLRNPHIARIAHKIRLVEKLGSGIRLIFDSCKKAGIVPPQYQEGGDFVKIIFNFEPSRLPQQSDEDAILSFVKLRGEISIGDVTHLLKISRNTATRKLNNLILQEKLIRIGKGPSVLFTGK